MRILRSTGLGSSLATAFMVPLAALFLHPTSSVALTFAPLKRCSGASVVRA